MSNITDYQMEQILFKLKANKNSKELKRQGKKLDLLELDPEVKALDEFIMQLKKRELMVDISNEESLDDYTSTEVELPELGRVLVYESSQISKQRKIDATKSKIEEENKTSSELENDTDKKSEIAKYSVISLKDEKGNPFDLVIDIDGNDVGKIVYDEKGKPSFEMSPELKEQIDDKLAIVNARSFVDEQTLQEEFYLKNIAVLERAIKEGKIVPETVKATGERAIAANNIKNKNYTTIDADKALTLTPEEKLEEKQIQENAKERADVEFNKSHLQTPENERDIVKEQQPQLEEEKIPTRNVQTQPNIVKTDFEDEKEIEEEKKDNDTIPPEKKDEVEEFCKKSGVSVSNVKAVLIILDPKTLADSTENSHINPYGNEVTVIQFSDVVGKDKYMVIQDGIDLGADAHDESFEHLIEPLHRTTGVVKRVEDEKSYVDYTDSSGEIQSMKLKRIPNDMSIQDKERFKKELAEDIAQLEMVRANEPENVECIDQLEKKVAKDFEEVGLMPPETIKQDAEEIKEESKNQEDDCYDEIEI